MVPKNNILIWWKRYFYETIIVGKKPSFIFTSNNWTADYSFINKSKLMYRIRRKLLTFKNEKCNLITTHDDKTFLIHHISEFFANLWGWIYPLFESHVTCDPLKEFICINNQMVGIAPTIN